MLNKAIVQIGRVFCNGTSDRSSFKKTQKIVLDAFLLNTQHHKVRIKSKVEQFREWSNALTTTSV